MKNKIVKIVDVFLLMIPLEKVEGIIRTDKKWNITIEGKAAKEKR